MKLAQNLQLEANSTKNLLISPCNNSEGKKYCNKTAEIFRVVFSPSKIDPLQATDLFSLKTTPSWGKNQKTKKKPK